MNVQLYNRYAKKFGLWECCLEILKVSGHNDPALTKKFWENIILEGKLAAATILYKSSM